MHKLILATAAAFTLMGGAGSAAAQSVGDWVLGNYQNSGYWFPGVISDVSNDKITIKYDDGDLETVYPNAVRPYNWSVGTRVECNWQNSGDWYAGQITLLNGDKVSVSYDDGDRENTRTGLCRSR
ncbi:tudor domain-containing protein [Aquamicrobium sp. NLF2-7]|uniref:tudor domain-containing protein n=1 Tax=unclassified Aquamicrobium TaxID=2618194 RepID=UPI001EFC01EE|nr:MULTISPECIES: tudor domain-containing protein [unclassified Aquamicrobium]MCG8271375.1 tudor domain-containing protein [Aquamicrobium sp. NLF2-7]MCK9551372.1 tudor domain-containing protein [Aquamicrobium sp.]